MTDPNKTIPERAHNGVYNALDDGVHRLVGYDNDNQLMPSVRPLLFGHLVKRAMLLVEHYESDLYHDAMWLQEHVTGGEFVFYFACRECGTSIGTDCGFVSTGNDLLWKVRVFVDRGCWYAEFKSGGCEQLEHSF